MKERELATLLIQMGVDSGVDIERAAEDLATVAFPSFVNAKSFRSALLDAIESHMRTQMEQRLQAVRQRFEAGGTSSWTPPTIVQPADLPVSTSDAQTGSAHGSRTPGHASAADAGMLDTIIGDIADDDGTSDDTIVWSPRRD